MNDVGNEGYVEWRPCISRRVEARIQGPVERHHREAGEDDLKVGRCQCGDVVRDAQGPEGHIRRQDAECAEDRADGQDECDGLFGGFARVGQIFCADGLCDHRHRAGRDRDHRDAEHEEDRSSDTDSRDRFGSERSDHKDFGESDEVLHLGRECEGERQDEEGPGDGEVESGHFG